MTENTSRQRRAARFPRAVPPWSLLAAGAVLGGVLGGAYGMLRTPTYTATSYLVVVPTERSDPADALGFAQAYGRVATQLAVLGDAQRWAGVPVSTLQSSVRTQTSPDAPMVSVSATSARPDRARDMANAVARSLTRHADATKSGTHVELLQFSRAVEPTTPTSASPEVTGLVGASAGGLLGGLVLLVRPRRAPEEGIPRAVTVPAPAVAADAHRHL
ncbi:lipopolysaccharide biosynthesis protein [Streptomyces olivochromogenes]|uniref:lipopolysaccharide biosynthesis protein n=1 Tax=Streptomyces olivochromogenes TaxID=1963 RepID=UPI001F40527E|nr:lipopolysaccharide biosynthesis protein [Streptomyces olivochromogenes]MCF3137472.1 lipopolysaccharide biosynthesis protein [Streptomyces olivochromogenes]